MKLLITIDTERDYGWDSRRAITTANARHLPRFQALCDKFDFKSTYLITYVMAGDEFCVEFAREALARGVAEVGAHLHAWNNPPDYSLTSNDNLYQPYLIEYPEKVMRDKLRCLTDFLQETFGVKMHTHRAGRWGFNELYARLLVELGYQVDCSIPPNTFWPGTHREPGEPVCPEFDFTDFPLEAYFLNEADISRPGDMPLLEIPMTTVPYYPKFLRNWYNRVVAGYVGKGMRFFLGRPVRWFRPHRFYKEMQAVARAKVKKSGNYLMFMTHSSELMSGGSPYFRTEAEIDKMYADMEEVFELLAQNGVTGATCYEYYQEYIGSPKHERK